MKHARKTINLNDIRVASPCHVSWESMHGDDRMRHCDSCKLNVYNISAMDADSVRDLIENREGRLCVRLFRRSDGTVLTRDCPVGIRKYQKRVARLAGAALTAILGLFSVSYGQKAKTVDAKDLKTTVTAVTRDDGRALLRGKVFDAYGASIPHSKISLLNEKGKKIFSTRGNDNGDFEIVAPDGSYALQVEVDGFEKTNVRNIVLSRDTETAIEIVLDVGSIQVEMGIFVDSNESSSAGGTTTLSGRIID